MPPIRRKTSNPTSTSSRSTRNAASAQGTLSFNSKSARVSKPAIVDPSKKAKRLSEPTIKAIEDTQSEEVTPAPEAVVQIPLRTNKLHIPSRDATEVAAEKITDAHIKRYWKAEEDVRRAPRVHQQLLTTHEKILRHFDISSQYGPCVGIPRLKRWKRAHGLGLNPPIEVLAVLLREEREGPGKAQVAYMDELGGGGKFLQVD